MADKNHVSHAFQLQNLFVIINTMVQWQNVWYTAAATNVRLVQVLLDVRIVQGSCDPLQVISLVECGIDMLDASYALHLTRRNAAIDADVLFSVDLDGVDPEIEQDILKSSTSFELKMSEPQYKEDFSPISSNCNCYTCLNHTRDEPIGGISNR